MLKGDSKPVSTKLGFDPYTSRLVTGFHRGKLNLGLVGEYVFHFRNNGQKVYLGDNDKEHMKEI